MSYETLPSDDDTKHAQLDLLAQNLTAAQYPGYPSFSDRLHINIDNLPRDAQGTLHIPHGPWHIAKHPNRPNPEVFPSPSEMAAFLDQGYELDTYGRPLHPWLRDMLERPDIGIVTGKGAYWHWGPNKTVDPVVFWEDNVLLVQRKDTGAWALPGGFLDNEPPLSGAIRELYEETGVIMPDPSAGCLIYEGPVVDTRVTAHAWPETSAFAFRLEHKQSLKHQESEVAAAAWVPVTRALDGLLFGSHRLLVERSVAATEAM